MSPLGLSPGQSNSQVDASFGLAFRLATHLRGLATTCVDFGRAQIRMQVDASFYRLATQRKSTQADRKSTVYA